MTPAEADERIILSRHTLARYNDMLAAGEVPIADLKLMADEVLVLEGIAEAHPIKAEKIAYLVERWVAFRDTVKAKLH